MTKSIRSETIGFLVLGVLIFLSTSCSHQQQSVQQPGAKIDAEQIAKAYGLDSFGQIDAIRYKWNAQFPGATLSHSWEWEPKTDQVTYEGNDKEGKPVKVTYLRSELSSQPDTVKNEVDASFLNDNYWLLFPLHAYWDKSATVTDEGMKQLPLGNGSGELVSVKYPSDGGYTPGDTWDLYIGKDNRVQQFVYHRGGPRKPSVVTATWEGYKKAGPLFFSTEHQGNADGNNIRIFISDVAVKVTGSQDWINAQ
jgi:hypothetical protein